MVDYAQKKKGVHYAIVGVFLFVGLMFTGLAYYDRRSPMTQQDVEFMIFDLKLMVGLLFIAVAGLWRAVIRLSTEVAALESQSGS